MEMETKMVKPGIWQAILTGNEKPKPIIPANPVMPKYPVDKGILDHVRAKVL